MENPSIKNDFVLYKNELHCVKEVLNDEIVLLLSKDGELIETSQSEVTIRPPGRISSESGFLFRIIDARDGRTRAFIGAILEPIQFEKRNLDIDNEEDEEHVNYNVITLITMREDLPTLTVRGDLLEVIHQTKSFIMDKEFKKEDVVRIFKKNKYTKSKRISPKDEFIIHDEFKDILMLKNDKNEIFYIDKKIVKRVNKNE